MNELSQAIEAASNQIGHEDSIPADRATREKLRKASNEPRRYTLLQREDNRSVFVEFVRTDDPAYQEIVRKAEAFEMLERLVSMCGNLTSVQIFCDETARGIDVDGGAFHGYEYASVEAAIRAAHEAMKDDERRISDSASSQIEDLTPEEAGP